MMRKHTSRVFAVATILGLTTPASALPLLIFSEVFYDPPGNESKEEWIEIYNPTLTTIDLTNYTIKDNAGTFHLPATTLASGATLVFARDSDAFFDLYGFLPDAGTLNLSLANSGDFLELFDDTNALLDSVAWENKIATWNISASENKSIVRAALPASPASWLSNQTPGPGNPGGLMVIPEPSSFLLLGLGLLATGASRRIRRRFWSLRGAALRLNHGSVRRCGGPTQ
ncbi:MAG: lamin tail domain-containing protein [bacterium]